MKLLSLEATLSLATKGFENGLKKAEIMGKSLLGKMGDISKGAATTAVRAIEGIGKAALVATGAVTALGGAFIPLVSQAVSSYGEYEQLVGGVETLFKEASDFVIQDAKEAYKTVGMSANQYMETATSFAASMIKSVGGNTQTAAEMTKVAMSDIADNVNKMGTSFESVEYAYKGFAKGNFTMLDNLKIGYGGTKSEMERLLKDADEINAKQGKITHYSMDNFSDIVQAIHVVQTEMGITGTTALEAEKTIQGSAASMKAAWANIITALGDSSENSEEYTRNLNNAIDGFTKSARTYILNVVPSVKQAVKGLRRIISPIATQFSNLIPELVTDILPDIIDTGLIVGQALIDGVFKFITPSNMSKIIRKVGTRLNTKLTDLLGIKRNASFTDIIAAVGDGLRGAAKNLIGTAKVSIAAILGLTDENGRPIVDPSDVTWARIAQAVGSAIAQAPGAVKVGICHLLGITKDNGDPVTDADDVGWVDIANTIVGKVQAADGVARLGLAALLGLKGEDGNLITDEKEVSWGTIAQTIVDKIKEAQVNTKGFLADLLGLNYESISDVSWGDIARGITRKLKDKLGNTKLFGDILDVTVEGLTAIIDFASAIGLELVNYLSNPANLTSFATALGTLVTGTLEKAPEWISGLGDLATNFITALSNPDTMKGIISAIFQALSSLMETLPEVLGSAGGFIDTIFQSLGVKTDFGGVINTLTGALGKLGDVLLGLFFNYDEKSGQYQLSDWLKVALIGISDALTVVATVLDGIATVIKAVRDFVRQIKIKILGEDERTADVTELGGATLNTQNQDYTKAAKQAGYAWDASINRALGDNAMNEAMHKAEHERRIGLLQSAKSAEEANALLKEWGVDFFFEVDDSAIKEAEKNFQAMDGQEVTGYVNVEYRPAGVHGRNPTGTGSVEGTGSVDGSEAKGMWTVPYDNFRARLHRDEMVLTASQARDYREGGGMDSSAIVAAIDGLRNDMQNLKLVVGQKAFGRAVVDYSGKQMQETIGRSEDMTYAGYGWG